MCGSITFEDEFNKKYPPYIDPPSAILEPFDARDLESGLLKYVYVDNKEEVTDMERMETIVKNLCDKLSASDPRRIEKLLNILDFKDALKLYMLLPHPYIEGKTMTAVDVSKRAKITPYMIDWIRTARDPPMNYSDNEILDEMFRIIDQHNL